MSTRYSDTDHAIMLLTVRFKGSNKDAPKPLTPTEYARFAAWLNEQDRNPENLIHDPGESLQDWKDPKGKIDKERLTYLLGRGMSLTIELEQWLTAGIWVATRANPTYPQRLKQVLGHRAPPLLFGSGNAKLLNQGGLGIVGSRAATEEDLEITRAVAQLAAESGIQVNSGAAKGVDTEAMQSALSVEGDVIGVVADSLMRQSLSKANRDFIHQGNLCLITPYHPESRFTAGAAMGRNAHLYALCDHVLIMCSDKGRGGTWNGAVEGRKLGIPLLVNEASSSPGAQALISEGNRSIQFPSNIKDQTEAWFRETLIQTVPIGPSTNTAPTKVQGGLFDQLEDEV